MDIHKINPTIKGSDSNPLGITAQKSGAGGSENFLKNFKDIFSRRGKQLARSEYRPCIRSKEEEEEDERRGEERTKEARI